MMTKEFSSGRRIDIVVPGSYCRKIIVVSTLWTLEEPSGSTAVAQIKALNALYVFHGLTSAKWKEIKLHNTAKEAFAFHKKYVEGLKYSDSEEIKDD